MSKIDNLIDDFVEFLIRENCEGCELCEPRLAAQWKPNFACVNEGWTKWLLDEAAEILKLMPKQSDVIKKAIEVLERTKWHTEPPTEEGLYLIHTDIGVFDFAKYSKDLYKVDKYDFRLKGRHRAGWWKYNSEWGFYEVTDVICWTYIPAYEGSES